MGTVVWNATRTKTEAIFYLSKKGHYLGGNQTVKVKNHFDLKDRKSWLFNRGQMVESAVDANRYSGKRPTKKAVQGFINQAWSLERQKRKLKKKLLKNRKTDCYD
mgnify:FL=1